MMKDETKLYKRNVKSNQKRKKEHSAYEKRSKHRLETEKRERNLEHLLFGGKGCDSEDTLANEKVDRQALVHENTAPLWIDADETKIYKTTKINGAERNGTESMESYLRAQFLKRSHGQKWVKANAKLLENGDSSDEDDNSLIKNVFEIENNDEVIDRENLSKILSSSKSLVSRKKSHLPQKIFQTVRCKDANFNEPSQAVVQSVQFHCSGQMLLTAGFDKKLRFFQIDEENNKKLSSVFFKDFPIHQAKFFGGKEVIVTGNCNYLYSCDVETSAIKKIHCIKGPNGLYIEKYNIFDISPDNSCIAFSMENTGYVVLVSTKTKNWIAEFKLNCPARTLSFSPDGNYILASGKDSEIFKFDMKMRRCVRRLYNEGGSGTSSMCIAPNDNYFSKRFTAVGSDSGIVNLYDESFGNEKASIGVVHPKPMHAFKNLTTSVSTMKFNHDAQILAIASNLKRDAFRLVHVASNSVFANWPTSRTPIGYAHSFDFSPQSKYLAVGNDIGKVLLYRLNHY